MIWELEDRDWICAEMTLCSSLYVNLYNGCFWLLWVITKKMSENSHTALRAWGTERELCERGVWASVCMLFLSDFLPLTWAGHWNADLSDKRILRLGLFWWSRLSARDQTTVLAHKCQVSQGQMRRQYLQTSADMVAASLSQFERTQTG